MAETPLIKTESVTRHLSQPTDDVGWSPKSKEKSVRDFSTSWSVSMPKSTAVKNTDIDIADILESKLSVNIDIGKGDINTQL